VYDFSSEKITRIFNRVTGEKFVLLPTPPHVNAKCTCFCCLKLIGVAYIRETQSERVHSVHLVQTRNPVTVQNLPAITVAIIFPRTLLESQLNYLEFTSQATGASLPSS